MINKSRFTKILLPILLLFTLSPSVSSGKILAGAILTGNIPYYMSMHKALVDELKKNLPPGEEIEFILQRPFPDPVAWSNAAKKLIVGGVDIIFSYGYPATSAVLDKRSDIPIVYVGVYDPEGTLSGENVTGCGYKVSLSTLLDNYRQVLNINRLCVVYGSNENDSVKQMAELSVLAEKHGLSLQKMDITSHKDLKIFRDLKKGDAVYFTGSTIAHFWIKDVLAFLRERKIPVADIMPHAKTDGVLVTLHQDPDQLGRKAAELAARILAGEKAGAVDQVVFEESKLVFNLNEAGLLEVSIPGQLIEKAAEVVE